MAAQGEEKTELRNREYFTLRAIMACIAGMAAGEETMKKRLHMIPNGYRDYRMITKRAESLYKSLLTTIPDKRLLQIKTEMKNAHIEVKVDRDITGAYKENFTYVPNSSLEALEDIICDMFCVACEKTEKESRKCKVRKLIESLYQYDFPERNGCPLATHNIED